jgi:hypothetical protein
MGTSLERNGQSLQCVFSAFTRQMPARRPLRRPASFAAILEYAFQAIKLRTGRGAGALPLPRLSHGDFGSKVRLTAAAVVGSSAEVASSSGRMARHHDVERNGGRMQFARELQPFLAAGGRHHIWSHWNLFGGELDVPGSFA